VASQVVQIESEPASAHVTRNCERRHINARNIQITILALVPVINSLHQYLYTGANPVNMPDPRGYDFDLPSLQAAAAAFTTLATSCPIRRNGKFAKNGSSTCRPS